MSTRTAPRPRPARVGMKASLANRIAASTPTPAAARRSHGKAGSTRTRSRSRTPRAQPWLRATRWPARPASEIGLRRRPLHRQRHDVRTGKRVQHVHDQGQEHRERNLGCGRHAGLPGRPLRSECGVDPYTGSGTTFARESGFNTYTIKVKNTASATLAAGDTLACQAGLWIRDESTFEYRWLRNGAKIAGAEGHEYTLTAEDEGKAIQCQVQGMNASFTTSAATPAVVVSPEPSTAPPAPSTEVKVSEESVPIAVETAETCETGCSAGEWSGSPTLSYQWLRNGTAITGATSSSYTPLAGDEGTAVELQVTATNAGGSVVADNRYPYLVEPAPSEESEYPAHPEEGSPALPSGAETTGPVTVADHLPEGLVLEGKAGAPAVSGIGWKGGAGEGSCKVARKLRGPNRGEYYDLYVI